MDNEHTITDIYLSAQSLFDHLIRNNSDLEPYCRIGFMATEIGLIMLEDTSLPTADLGLSMAGVFAKLSTECLKETTPDSENLAKTFTQCEVTTKNLAEHISNRNEFKATPT